jgi:hypothetical protein
MKFPRPPPPRAGHSVWAATAGSNGVGASALSALAPMLADVLPLELRNVGGADGPVNEECGAGELHPFQAAPPCGIERLNSWGRCRPCPAAKALPAAGRHRGGCRAADVCARR